MDPTNGMFTDAGSAIANTSTHVFTVPPQDGRYGGVDA